MTLSDKEIEEKIEKTVLKLEKFYRVYNVIYKIKSFVKNIKEKIQDNFFTFLILYTAIIYCIFRSLS